MADLRWTLLGIGVVFILGLVLWEKIKRRRMLRPDDAAEHTSRGAAPTDDDAVAEPTMRPTREWRRESAEQSGDRIAMDDLPVIDLDSARVAPDSHGGLRHVDEHGNVVAGADDLPGRGMRVESMPESARQGIGESGDPAQLAERWIAAAGVRTLRADDLRVEWPPDDQRTIVALRVAARGTERIGGRTLRQSLVGEGFLLGAFDIFHLPLADGRVIVSAASLTKPGTFAQASIDTLTFAGLNLFAVLPGPLSGLETLERLIASGRLLAQRMRADLLDSQGQPLTEARVSELRQRVSSFHALPPGGAPTAGGSEERAAGDAA